MKLLTNKTALITGSSSGIGEAIALKFASQGANVIITYNSGKDRAAIVKQKAIDLGVKAEAFQLDVSNIDRVKEVYQQISKSFKDIEILVNNAGVNGKSNPVEEMSIQDWDKTMKTDLYGPFYMVKEFLKLKKQYNSYKHSRIINITSIHEYICRPGDADYNSAKAAMGNFCKTLAIELANKELTVNNIAPGMILTPINKKVIENKELLRQKEQIIPLKRAGLPEEVANVALFLASEMSSYVTGSTYVVDGALSILGQDA